MLLKSRLAIEATLDPHLFKDLFAGLDVWFTRVSDLAADLYYL